MSIHPARFLLFVLLLLPAASSAQDLPTIEAKTEGMTRQAGFLPLYWDATKGELWMEIGVWDTDLLYVPSLPAGLGSNDVGLDRGLMGGEQVVRFKRVGPKVLMEAPNLQFRALTENAAERAAVADAFASSIGWGFTVAAQTGDRALVDITPFVLRDAMGVVRSLNGMQQGSFRLEGSRSAVYLERTKAFPDNTELEAQLTFLSDNPGRYVRAVASDPYAVTLRMRQSFVRLPELGSYTPRPYDPRSGSYGIEFVDYATPVSEPKEVRYLARHRLVKADPNAAVSDPVEPIVYYLDPGTPEPIRSALLDGARWWADAYEAAGFRNAFRVEMLPDTADAMDLRYNVIQWVHRSTRGWSYGRSVTDPRTGEILKGIVSLGSLRVRQDYLLAAGLLSPYRNDGAGLPPDSDPMLAMALARLRQLSAHEVGHTLGLMHNFASSVNDRASVMDYPAPLIRFTADGALTLDEAYDTGIGAWDKVAIRYSYSQFPAGVDERAELNRLLDEASDAGLLYISDTDARPQGGAHPAAHLWDNGSDPVLTLEHDMQVRSRALAQFGLGNVRAGWPLATLEEALVPVYLWHRYQIEAVAKLIGGVDYTYALRGDTQALPEAIPGARQKEALDALLKTVTPAALRLPQNLRTQLPPRPPGYAPHPELFDGHTGLTFDPYAPAEAVASLTFGMILRPERAARLVNQHDFDDDLPEFRDVLTRVFDAIWDVSVDRDDYDAELQRLVQQVWVDQLLALATNAGTAYPVRARALLNLREIQVWLEQNRGRDPETIAHRDLIYDDIQRVMTRKYEEMENRTELDTPPGSPIGQEDRGFVSRQRRRAARLEAWLPDEAWCGVE
ncbi:MAG: zinc-dependent metalloprotease [Rhodothermales bacterium]